MNVIQQPLDCVILDVIFLDLVYRDLKNSVNSKVQKSCKSSEKILL